jgi:hypothetical protein
VPDVKSEDVGTARATLTHAGLNSRLQKDSTSTAPANTVTRQTPRRRAMAYINAARNLLSVPVEDADVAVL